MTRCEFVFAGGQRCQYPAGHGLGMSILGETHSWEVWVDDLCRAALRERDAAWAAAVKRSQHGLTHHEECECRALRALLEEAGSNG